MAALVVLGQLSTVQIINDVSRNLVKLLKGSTKDFDGLRENLKLISLSQ